jgi:hypothetical protein
VIHDGFVREAVGKRQAYRLKVVYPSTNALELHSAMLTGDMVGAIDFVTEMIFKVIEVQITSSAIFVIFLLVYLEMFDIIKTLYTVCMRTRMGFGFLYRNLPVLRPFCCVSCPNFRRCWDGRLCELISKCFGWRWNSDSTYSGGQFLG